MQCGWTAGEQIAFSIKDAFVQSGDNFLDREVQRSMHHTITSEIVVAYSQCHRKAFLLLCTDEPGLSHECDSFVLLPVNFVIGM